jgi:agmatinase
MIGGEHLVTLGAVRALASGCENLRVVHFDAHADMRDEYMGEKLSHATVMRRVWDILGDGRIYQFGIRSGCRDELEWSENRVAREFFAASGIGEAAREIGRDPIYLTVDLDVLDPSQFPGTGTPEAGGMSFGDLLGAILEMKGLNVKGFDICELSPHYDQSGASTALACKILREMLLAFSGK